MVSTNQIMDERSAQNQFYENMFGPNWQSIITVDRSTDGYSDYVLFEHKKNISVTGIGKCLGQALIYLAKFNRDGVPVPNTIMLVSQDENKVYVFKTDKYADIINDNSYAQRAASGSLDITILGNREPETIISYGYSAFEAKDFLNYFDTCNDYFKVTITDCNVVGWSEYYYDNAEIYKLKPTKIEFFKQLRTPTSFMDKVIKPWTGVEEDFSGIMDLLNDPAEQKILGAFYTPEQYCKKAAEMLEQQIEKFKAKYPEDDYLIIDRCAGSGNLENVLSDDLLSHCIVSTYELKEWIALKNRIGRQVRMIIPHMALNNSEPEHNEDGTLIGSDALSEEFNESLKKYIEECKTTEHCGIFFFENPPYSENQAQHGGGSSKKDKDNFKNSWLFKEMAKEVSGTALNDLANVFIWSAFKMFLKSEDDGYVVFAPIKYWKIQSLINKKFVEGFLANRKYFHATDAAISVISWKNIESAENSIRLSVYDIVNNRAVKINTVDCKRINNYPSKMYDKRKFEFDTEDGILVDQSGFEKIKRTIRCKAKYNNNILGYLIASGAQLDTAGNDNELTITGNSRGNGFFLRKDNFLTKLPLFVAGEYGMIDKRWWGLSFYNKSSDGSERFEVDVKSGVLNDWLIKCMLWTCWCSKNHMVSFVGSDGRMYTNNLALLQNSLADKIIADYHYEYNKIEKALKDGWEFILTEAKAANEYNPEYKYGLYQIKQEINIKEGTGTFDRNGKEIMRYVYPDLNRAIVEFEKKVNEYYMQELVENLLKYEFIK